MNVEIGNEAVQFHFWDYINWIFFAVCMYMTVQNSLYKSSKFATPSKWEVQRWHVLDMPVRFSPKQTNHDNVVHTHSILYT